MAKQQIKAFFFDIDDTLYATTEFTNHARYKAVQAMVDMGLKMHPDDLLQELKEVISEFSSNYPDHFGKLLDRIPKEHYQKINKSMLIASAVVAYHDTKHSSLVPYQDALEFVKSISNYNVTKGIITAGLKVKQAEKLVRLRIYPYLDTEAIFISDQVGISKPNPKLYRYACKSMGVKPNEVIYFGDNPPHDIDPPNQIGMITVLVRKGGKHNHLKSHTQPRYEIQSFKEFLSILEKDFYIEKKNS